MDNTSNISPRMCSDHAALITPLSPRLRTAHRDIIGGTGREQGRREVVVGNICPESRSWPAMGPIVDFYTSFFSYEHPGQSVARTSEQGFWMSTTYRS